MKSKIKMCIFCSIFVILTIWGGYKLWSTLHEYQSAANTYGELEQYVNIESEQKEPIQQYETEKFSLPTVDFESLKSINTDVVAWIYSESLDINYPILQGKDNDYYLKHMVDGSYNKLGSIFLDYRNQENLNDRHTIIYGHNMLDGSMFSVLTKYKEQEFFDENPVYTIITPDKNYKVEIFSGYVANVNNDAWKLEFSTDEEFENWIKTTKEKSLFTSDITPTTEDEIITLSTCSYEFDNARFVLIGKLTEY